jgi:thiamine-phosphate pyrophosphorylase
VSAALLCLVTDRRRLAARIGCDEDASLDWLVRQVRAAAQAGVDLVQVREGDLPAAKLVALARKVVEAVTGTGARVVVNDRVDVALAARAHGVHLKAASVAPTAVRGLLAPGALIGVSVHDAAAAALQASHVDYLIAGAVRPTASKPAGWPTLGMAGLAEIVRASAGVPVLGIGGLDAGAAADVRRAGAGGMAAIDAFLPADGSVSFDDSVHEIAAALRLAFDSPERVT